VSKSSGLTLWQRLIELFPAGQLVRYLCVGVFNTLFGYASFATILTLLNKVVPHRWLSLTVILASILSTPLSITVAYFGYKLFVFRTKGNHLREWLKAFAVYGTAMIPGLLILGALTRLLQSLFHSHPVTLFGRTAGTAAAGYIAGAIVMGFSTISSFIGHKKVTFREQRAPVEQAKPTE
jgi:putative flippase GtrA